MPPCVSSGTHSRRGKRLKKSMCDLERARPKRCVSFRSRKKVAVESQKKKKKKCDFWRALSSLPTSKLLVQPCVSSETHPKRAKRFVKKAMCDLERERPKRCVEKIGSRVQKKKKKCNFRRTPSTWNEMLVICVFTVKHTDATLNVGQCVWLRLKTSHSQLNVYFCFIFIVVITKSIL